ncbi:hypothetical protein LINPERHAP1_LOCUS21110 [Linum perenne]
MRCEADPRVSGG